MVSPATLHAPGPLHVSATTKTPCLQRRAFFESGLQAASSGVLQPSFTAATPLSQLTTAPDCSHPCGPLHVIVWNVLSSPQKSPTFASMHAAWPAEHLAPSF